MGYIGNRRSERSQFAIESGLVTKSQLKAWQKRAVLPSPLEADRFISFGVTNYKVVATVLPSPLEVNRFISLVFQNYLYQLELSYRPLSR